MHLQEDRSVIEKGAQERIAQYIRWDERLYDELCKVLPKDLRKSLERSKTIFHAYKK